MEKKRAKTSETKSYTPACLTREHPESSEAPWSQQKLPPAGSLGRSSPGLLGWLSNTRGSAAAQQSLTRQGQRTASQHPSQTNFQLESKNTCTLQMNEY